MTIVGVFYGLGRDAWQDHEYYYEGAFSLLASVVITLMGGALLRVNKMQAKWQVKLAKAMEPVISQAGRWARVMGFLEKYALFVLPFITVLREGIEGIVFVAGVSFSAPVSAIPLAVIAGLLVGALAGYALYRCASQSCHPLV